jgi:uncharacterized protein (TIGR03545 family)
VKGERDVQGEKEASEQPDQPRKQDKDKGWLRWWGLGVFVLLTAVLAAFWFLFLDLFVKRMIEQTGTSIVGAKVELASADVSLFPFGLTLTRLQVTNPDEPMTNVVEIGRIACTVDGLNLLRRKVIIEEMALEGLKLGTARQTAGAVGHQPKEGALTKLAGTVSLPSFEVPDVKTIVAGADLESVKLIESLRAEIQSEQDNWKKRLADLPDKAKLNDYKTRIERLKSSAKGGVAGILGATGEVTAIQKDLERDLERIQSAKMDFETKLTLLKQRMDQAVKAPQEDVRRLQEKYSLSPQGLANMSGMLLKGQGGEWVRKGLVWYGKLQPILARAKEQKKGHEVVKPLRGRGLDVRFTEQAPLPDFLIRLAKVSVQLETGDVTGRIENITPDQDVLGKPLTFAFDGDKLKGLQSIRLDGVLNHVAPASAKDTVQLRVRGYQVQDVVLSESADWPVTMDKALADMDLQASVSGQALAGAMTAGLKSARLIVGKQESSNQFVKAIGSALSEVSAFAVKADVTGTLDQYEIHLTSDLDRVLKEAAGKLVQDYANRITKELEAAVMAKVGGPLSELKGSFSGLGGIGDELTARLTQGAGSPKGSPEKLLPGDFKLPF